MRAYSAASRQPKTVPVPDDYEEWVTSKGENEPVWRGLGRILGDRSGWYFAAPGADGGGAWCFGLEGEPRLVATAVEGMCHLYNHDRDNYSDSDLFFDIPADFEDWLAAHQSEHQGCRRLGLSCRSRILRVGLRSGARPKRRATSDPRLVNAVVNLTRPRKPRHATTRPHAGIGQTQRDLRGHNFASLGRGTTTRMTRKGSQVRVLYGPPLYGPPAQSLFLV